MRLLPMLLLLGAAGAAGGGAAPDVHHGARGGARGGAHGGAHGAQQTPTFQQPQGRSLCDVVVPDGRPLCDCDLGRVNCTCPPSYQEELVLQSRGPGHLPPNVREVSVQRCARVRVVQAAFAALPALRRVSLEGVASLRVEPYGFSWNESTASPADVLPMGPPPGLHVNLTNCSVPELASFAFLGRLEAVTLAGLRVGAVRAFAFASLRDLRRLAILDCDLERVEAQAFKKFSVEQLLIRGGRVRGALPSRAFQDVDVRGELTLEGVHVEAVHSAAFKVHGPQGPRRVLVAGNTFNVLRGEAFAVVTHGPVHIVNNKLGRVETGAFVAITVDWFTAVNSGPQALRFENNTLSAFEDGAIMFNTTGLEVGVGRVLLDMPCDCAVLEHWGRDLLNVPRYPTPPLQPSVAPDALLCRGGARPARLVTVADFKAHSCGFLSFSLDVLLVVAASLGALLVAGLVLAVCCCRRRAARRRKRRRWDGKQGNGTNGTHAAPTMAAPTVLMDISDDKEVQEALRRKPSRAKSMQFKRVIQPEEERMLKGGALGAAQQGPYTLVVPDGRVYRETELHVIVERAEPLRPLRPLREQEPGG